MQLPRTLLSTTCLTAALLCAPMVVMANPTGGVVSGGSATISSSGSTLTINQQSGRAIIDWRGFDIGAGETTQFVQPNSSSLTLNRVNSSSASVIDGNLQANGNIVIINQNGVLFGQGAKVDVNGLIASTADTDNATFMAGGKLILNKPGLPTAGIVNAGTITAQQAGLVGFVAPNVANSGIITANLGRIQLASGDTATVDMYGDHLMEVAVSDQVKSQIVSNSGLLQADGGKVALTAAAGTTIVNSLINVSGRVQAQSVGTKNGQIVIVAAGSNAVHGNIAANKGKKQGQSTVLVSGTLDASGRNAGEHGGKVTVTGDNIALLSGSFIDASGSDGLSGTTNGLAISAERIGAAGGDIKIGGDYLGGGDTPTALNLYISPGALILNDAINSGDAGRTIFWADGTTQFYGNVYARALGGQAVDATTWNATSGGNTGNGGFVETSGHGYLDAQGYVDLTASNGARGTYFLDPTDITIYGNVTPNFVSTDGSIDLASNLKLWLDASDTSNVVLTYNGVGDNATGNAGQDTLTFDSTTGLAVGARIRIGGAGASTTADTLGADTYTITNIAGNTVTLSANLTSTYAGAAVYQGYVSTINDKSAQANNATQTDPTAMPLWISNGQNGIGEASYNGSDILTNFNNLNFNLTDTTIFNLAQETTHTNYAGVLSIIPTIGNDYFSNTGLDFETSDGTHAYDYGFASNNNTLYNPSLNQTLTLAIRSTVQDGTNTTATSYVNGVNVLSQGGWVSPNGDATSGYVIGGRSDSINGPNVSNRIVGDIDETIIYNSALSDTARTLVEQYQSAKWGIALTPPGTGATEVAQATASDGYSVFTTSYLNRLSSSANIDLQASHDINLDLQGDTLSLAAGRSLTLTAGHQITTAVGSTGTISTTNGDIDLNATNGIVINSNYTLASNGGNINLNNAVTLNANLTTNSGTGTTTFASTVNGAHNLTASGNTLSFASPLGGSTALGDVNLTSTSGLTLPSINASTITAQTTGATSDLTLANGTILTASHAGRAVTLAAGRNFINHDGASTLVTSGAAGSWLIYSTNGANNTAGGLTADFKRYSCTYGGICPTLAANGDGFLYSYTPLLNVTPAALAAINYNAPSPLLTAYGYTLSGYLSGDLGQDTIGGSINGTTNYAQGNPAGSYSITYNNGSLTSAMGYGFTYANNLTGITVNGAATNNSAPSAAINYSNFIPLYISQPVLTAPAGLAQTSNSAPGTSPASNISSDTPNSPVAPTGSTPDVVLGRASYLAESNQPVSAMHGLLQIDPQLVRSMGLQDDKMLF